jgi:hypothetical protein
VGGSGSSDSRPMTRGPISSAGPTSLAHKRYNERGVEGGVEREGHVSASPAGCACITFVANVGGRF